MRTVVELKPKDNKLFVPETAKITKIETFTEKEKYYALELDSGKSLGHDPGQFVQVSVFGIGEAPISISSAPSNDNKFELCVRAAGQVTNKIHDMKVGDTVFVRGPFGHGFDKEIISKMKGKHLLFVAGGLGYAPLRSLINKVVKEKNDYKKISILYGYKNPKEILYKKEVDEIANMGGNIELIQTVDKGDDSWKGNVGVITTLIPKVDFDPEETIAVIVGPPIMYKFVLISLFDKNIKKENIYVSLERRMKCGIGKCGHCMIDGTYVCQEGPVFNYLDVEDSKEAL